MQRLLPPHLVALLLATMIVTAAIAPWPRFAGPLRLAGVLLIVVGCGLAMGHARLFRRRGTNIQTFGDPDMLVTEGAFRWSRNPMYLGFILVLTGAALALGSAAAFIGPVGFFGVANRWYVPFEERRMTAHFGSDYILYTQHVRRWIGRRTS